MCRALKRDNNIDQYQYVYELKKNGLLVVAAVIGG